MKLVFLDRDGVINEYPGDFQYVTSWDKFRFLPGVHQAIQRLNRQGYKVFVISNQAGVSKGIYPKEELDFITRNMLKELNKLGAHINGVYYCTHTEEDNCNCRKPKTGLVEKVIAGLKKNGVLPELSDSYFVGDSIRDIDTGKAARLKTILVFSGKEKPENKNIWQTLPDFTAKDLSGAVEIILKNSKTSDK